ncbi:chorismate mutase [Streptomyces tremellae]|uniref:chorismate mutase n=1 Tax=Streptomyces tremellae TaxID=1124239 RepID=UPI0031E79168
MTEENPGASAIAAHREEIDELDLRIIELLEQRSQISRRIQSLRVGQGGTRTVLSREMTVLEQYTARLGRPGAAIAMSVLEFCRGVRPGDGSRRSESPDTPAVTAT